ncbi:MAG: metallophosphoesterase, partial [Anaerolineae bacterium]|nr:metallophosphoesterase [Anaerolineae bacterium]
MEVVLVGMLSLLLIWGYARYIEPEWVQTTRFNLTLPRLAPEFDGYRVVQFSDLHLDSWLGGKRLAKIVAKVNAENPDAVVITGDFVGRHLTSAHADELRRMLHLLTP